MAVEQARAPQAAAAQPAACPWPPPQNAGVRVRDTFYTRHGKRALDVAAALLGLTAALPLLAALALVTYWDVGRPVLFRQTRIGKNDEPFLLVKFRNMTEERDAQGHLLLARERVTRVGRIVRGSSLDELPQLLLVLKGEMSLIGPRPLLPEYLCRYSPRQRMRHAVRPGLDCPMHRPLGHPCSWEEQFENDIWYVEHCSLAVDLALCLRLLQSVLDREARQVRAAADRGAFREEEFGEIR